MLALHASGTLIRAPESKTSAAGKPWLRLILNCAAGGDYAFVSCAVFDAELISRLTGLQKGDTVSVAGPATVAAYEKNGEPKASVNLIANAVLSARDGRRRKARADD